MSYQQYEELRRELENTKKEQQKLEDRVDNMESDVNDIKTAHKLTEQRVDHLKQSIDELKAEMTSVGDDIKQSVAKINKVEKKPLETYKTIVITVITGIAVGVTLYLLGIK